MNQKFEEQQKVDTIWPLGMVAITLVGNWILYFMLKHDDLSFFYISVTSVCVLSLFISSLKLNTMIADNTFLYKMFPFHFKWQEIPFKSIRKLEIRTFKPLSEYGGWGLRRGKSGRAYTIKGNTGLQLTLNDDSKILFGTNKKEELSNVIKTLNK